MPAIRARQSVMDNFSQIAPFIPITIVGLTALVGLRAFVMDAPLPLKMLSQLWFVTLAADIIGTFIWKSMDEQNKWVYNLYYFFFFFYLASIYSQVLERVRIRITIRVFYGVFIVFTLINSLFLQGIWGFQSLTYVVGGVFLIYLSGGYFWQLMVSTDNEKITHDPFFWLSFALIVYLGGTVPFYGMLNYLEKNFFDFTEFYHMHIYNAFAIFLNVFVMVAFLCRKNYRK